MSLKRTAMRMALAFAAAKGYQAFRNRGGMQGVKDMLAGGGGAGTGARTTGSGGGLSSLLGGLGGGGGGAAAGGGLMGALAAMAGGTSATAQGADHAAMADNGPQDDDTAAVMIRAIGQAVRADGVIDAEERALLDQIVGDAQTAEDRAAIDAALSEPVHPEALARDVPRGHETEVYAAALTAIDPDRPEERSFLKRFATALALDPGEVADLHRTAGKPAP
ncbi:MAG: DUF533 domain-containing protein [Pseudomonadota bacterium]